MKLTNEKDWINNFAKIFKTKKTGMNIISIPLAEPVTLKLQRKGKDGVRIDEVTLVPSVNERGYSSVTLLTGSPSAEYKVNENHIFDVSAPPKKD
jgi:hypothetical protein